MGEEKENLKNTTENTGVNKEKSNRKLKKIFILIIPIILFLIIVSTIFAILNINNEKIVKGVCVQGVDLSDMTEQEALNVLKEKIEKILKNDISLVYGEYSTTITPEQIEFKLNYEEAVNEANSIGKKNNILIDNFNILKAKIFKTNIKIKNEYNKEILQDIIKNINSELPGAVKEVSYEIDNDKLIITKGNSGIYIDSEKLKNDIINNINSQLIDIKNDIQIPVKEKNADPIDIEKIYKEIYKESKDAYIEEDPFKLHVEEDGLDFAISMEEAKKIISEEKDSYEIPLKIDKAKVKTEDLGDKLFKETLSKFTTIYDAGNTSRGTNIAIAARTINNTVILPGETFSYNKILGNTTKEKGYQLGTAYVGGKVVPAYGGGICQVSTTLYNAAIYANLEIVERYNHSYSVSYVSGSRDATVSYGGKDFKFKNSRTYPIKIVASAKNGVISVSLKGIKEEKEYDIEITSTTLSTTPYQTTYQDNPNLEEGKQKVIKKYVSKETTKEEVKVEENKIETADITENED